MVSIEPEFSGKKIMPATRTVLIVMLCMLAVSACATLKQLLTPLPAREVRIDARESQQEITHVYVYNFVEKYEKADEGFRLRSDLARAWDAMEAGFKQGMRAQLIKHPVAIKIDSIRDLKNNGGSVEAYVAVHQEAERKAPALYRLVLDPEFYYREWQEPQLPEGSVTLTVTLIRIADNKLLWEAVYRRRTSGYYYNGGYSSMAREVVEQAMADLFGAAKP